MVRKGNGDFVLVYTDQKSNVYIYEHTVEISVKLFH